ncbi:N-acetyl-anhydromuranmyl-L-alanine amidase [Alishewanella longhuensis]
MLAPGKRQNEPRVSPTNPLGTVTQRASAHYDDRPSGEQISFLVFHNISLPAGKFATDPETSYRDALFCGTLDPAAHPSFAYLARLGVAAHFVIWGGGQIF